MPTSTFMNLPEEKKEKIIQAAVNEFSSVHFDKASINQIVKEAGISRGSFYMYFEDIYDLALYIMNQMKEQIVNDLRERRSSMTGQLDDFIIQLHDVVYDYYSQETYRNLLRNLIVYFQGRPEDEIRSMKGKAPIHKEFKTILDMLDPDQFKGQEPMAVSEILDMCMMLFRNVMFKTFIMSLDKESSSRLLKDGLNILKHGYGGRNDA